MAGIERHDECVRIELDPRVVIEVGVAADGRVSGIGEVVVDGVRLRDGAVPLYPWIRSIDGYDYARFVLRDVESLPGGGVVIHTAAIGEPRLESPYGDQYNGNLLMVSLPSRPAEDTLDWILEPAALELDGVSYRGFTYRWSFSSQTQRLHRIVAHATWEIGGRATGNTILSQGQVTPAEHTVEPGDAHFTSACLQSLMRFGDPMAMSFQLCPRWGMHQCFDFLAHAEGTLLGYWEGRHDTRSFLQRNPGEEVIFVIDAEHWKATSTVSTAAKSIVFAAAGAAGMPSHVSHNRWMAAYEYCTGRVRRLFNIRKSIPAPERALPQSSRVCADGRLEMRVGDAWVDSHEWLVAMADVYFPTLAAQGIRRVITESIVESDPTERGFIGKVAAQGVHGDWDVGSVCCVHRYRPASLFGGMAGWRYFCGKAHALGMEAGHWIGPHLAHHAPILQAHPDWAVRGFNTLHASGGYPNSVLATLNWNTPVRQWILDDLRRMREEGGLDYVWFDSFANLGFYPIDFAREMETNTFPILEFMADLQDAGIANLAVEGMSAVAMSGAWIMDEGAGHDGGVQWIAGQNDWSWYEGREDMLCGQQPRLRAHASRGEADVRNRLFRCLANHCVPEIMRIMPLTGAPDPLTGAALARYAAVRADMLHREVLADGRGILWRNGSRRTLFAYKDLSLALPAGVRADHVEAGGREPVGEPGVLPATAWNVYQWEG